jgi:hypothetical protein
VSFFTPDKLWEHINGQAELFLSYGVKSLTFASYENRANPNKFIEVLVYDMGNPTHAFGIFSVEKRREASALNLGRMGYLTGSNYYVWTGPYYIQVLSSESSEELKRTGLDIMQRVVGVLFDGGEPVWGLTVLSKTRIIPGSVQYFRRNAVGLDFLENTYTARFRVKKDIIKVFLTMAENGPSAAQTMKQYEKYARQFGEHVRKKKEGAINMLLADMGDGYDVILQRGSLMGGVLTVVDENLAREAAQDFWSQLPHDHEDN